MLRYGWEPFMVSCHSAKFGGHKQCGSGDTTFLVVEKQDSTCSCLNPPLLPLLFISKAHGMLYLHKRNFAIKRTLTKTLAMKYNDISPIMVTLFLVNELLNIVKKASASPFLKHCNKGVKEKKL